MEVWVLDLGLPVADERELTVGVAELERVRRLLRRLDVGAGLWLGL